MKEPKEHSGWRTGDLGRYVIESPLRPRFETIRANKEEGVVVWYHMALKPQAIRPDQFREECIKEWSMRYYGSDIPDLELTRRMIRVKPGDLFKMPPHAPVPWRVNGLPGDVDTHDAQRTMDFIGGKILKVRRVRKDFCSCDVDDTIVLLPTAYLLRNDHDEVNLWSALLEDNY